MIIKFQSQDQYQERGRKILLFIMIHPEENCMKLNLKNTFQIRIKNINKKRSLKNIQKKILIDILKDLIHQLNHLRDSKQRMDLSQANMIKMNLYHKTMTKL